MVLAGELASPETLSRFRVEARAVAQMQHPNLVQIHEVGEHDGRPYLAFEFVAGGGLDQRLRGEPQPPQAAARLIRTLAHAIQLAHSRAIVHRDLKPANILLATSTKPPNSEPRAALRPSGIATETSHPVPLSEPRTSSSLDNATRSGSDPGDPYGLPKIGDFGLAKDLENDSQQTRTGAILGTPSYMAPEQAAGKTDAIGPATDVYALGAILYEMLTGRPQFRAPSVIATLDQVRSMEPLSLRRILPTVPRDLDTICLKCLQKEPTRRYASAGALADDLDRYLSILTGL
jgi:serine/threonine protein kinase